MILTPHKGLGRRGWALPMKEDEEAGRDLRNAEVGMESIPGSLEVTATFSSSDLPCDFAQSPAPSGPQLLHVYNKWVGLKFIVRIY